MAERKAAKQGFTAAERAAMKERAHELKADKADGESGAPRRRRHVADLLRAEAVDRRRRGKNRRAREESGKLTAVCRSPRPSPRAIA